MLGVFRVLGCLRRDAWDVRGEVDGGLTVRSDCGDVEDNAVACDVRARGDVAAVLRRLIGARFDLDVVMVGRAKHAGALVAKGVGECGVVGVAAGGAKHAVISMSVDGLAAVPVKRTLATKVE